MKNTTILIVIFLTLFSCKKEQKIIKKTPQKSEGYHIIGHVEKFENNKVYLQQKNINKSFKTIATTMVSNNVFEFSNSINNPELYYIGFESSDHKIPVIANNFETLINININDLSKTSIKGSEIQTNYNTYLTNLTKAKNKFVYKLNYIKTNNNSILSAIVLKQMLGKTKWRLGQNRKAFNYLTDDIKNGEIGTLIDNFLVKNEPLVKNEKIVEELSLDPEIANIVPKVQVIKEVPKIVKKPVVKKPVYVAPKRRKALNFSAESQHGGDVSLNQIKANAKVVLIDFWASWCGPCRKSNPHLIQLYNKYHDKGFNIISVSEDKESQKNNWINAIAVDNLPWPQVIDDFGRIAEMYNVSGIPHTVLIDSKGGIIFEKKSSFTIEKELQKIFGF